ncbi:MAG: EAL domain-containing protein [Pseudonocardia sp.]
MVEPVDGPGHVDPRPAPRPRPHPHPAAEQVGPADAADRTAVPAGVPSMPVVAALQHGATPSAPEPGLTAVARAELRRARQAVFGSRPASPEMTVFADRVARAVVGREPFVPSPNTPGGSGRMPAVGRPMPAPHEVVATSPGRDATGDTVAPAPAGPESVPLPAAPALVCDGSDRIVRVNAALLVLAGRSAGGSGAGAAQASAGSAGLFGMRLPQLVVGPDSDARLVRPDGRLVRVRVLRWDVPDRELHAVVLVELGATAEEERAAERRRTDELERLAHAGTWTYELASGTLRRSAALEDLYRAVGLDPARGRARLEGDQVARLCAALRAGGDQRHTVSADLELPGGFRLECRAEVEYGQDGAPARLVGVVRDVTAQRVAAERAARSGRRFADLVAVLPGGVAMVEPGGRIVDANPAMAAMLGTPVERLRGLPVSSLAVDPAEERPAGAFPQWLRLIRPGPQHGYAVDAVALRRGDGSTAWADLRISVTATEDGGWFWMIVCSDLAERRAAQETLRRVAHTDAVTGLPMRAAAVERLDALLAGPRPGSVAVVCAGVDGFGRVNAAAGHGAGDAVLATLARRLDDELPEGCTAARLAGDEFLVVCADHAPDGGPAGLARSVVGILSGGMMVDGRPVRLTASAGVACAGGATTADDLVRHAEIAMRDAKARRAGYAVASPGLVASAGALLRLEADLRAAFATPGAADAAGLVLHFQPVVGPDGVVRSAEALVRWEHPERGPIPPGEFLPIAERCGLMRELDLWVLRTACREAARWPAHDGRVPAVAVNLAGLLPADPGFVAAVTGAVDSAGLGWHRLVLELVESSLVELPPGARTAMAELAGRGVRFAVDDFGTGWSGLSRLRDLSAHVVKLDRSFVTGVAADPTDAAVARAVVELARVLGCAVVAEGVETPEQYRALLGLGIDSFQGWLFARAMPSDGLRALLVGDRLDVPR